MLRDPPLPRNGLPRPTSGVEVDLINPTPCPLLSIPLPRKSTAKLGQRGLAKFGWLRTLKKSARNCILSRSVSFVSFTTEKSQFLNVGPFNEFRPTLPKCWPVGSAELQVPNPAS